MNTRTTITIDEDLLDRLKMRATRDKTTVSALVEEDLRVAEARRAAQSDPSRPRFTLPTFYIEPLPGVDLNDNAALLDLMESDE